MKTRAQKERERRQQLKAENRCQECEQELDREGAYCKKCLDTRNQRQNTTRPIRRQQLKDQNRCQDCGAPKYRTGYYCSKCKDEHNQNQRAAK